MATNPDSVPEQVHWEDLPTEELLRRSGVKPVERVEDMARPEVFESDEEVEDFIRFVRELRHADLA